MQQGGRLGHMAAGLCCAAAVIGRTRVRSRNGPLEGRRGVRSGEVRRTAAGPAMRRREYAAWRRQLTSRRGGEG